MKDDLSAARGIIHGLLVSVLLWALIFVAWSSINVAFAGGKMLNPDKVIYQNNTVTNNRNQDQAQDQAQEQAQSQSAEAIGIGGDAAAAAEAINEGNSLAVNQNYESGPADAVLVPNNNTENCLRVIGLMFGNKDGSGMLGLPFRSKKCDFEQAADDAFAGGERELGWFWKCHNPNLYRQFRDPREKRPKMIDDCVKRMVGPITIQRRLEAANDQLKFIENERKIERQNYIDTREQLKQDCAEALDRQHQTCMEK